MSILYKILLKLFFFTMPMTHAFALNGWFPLPFVLMLVFVVTIGISLIATGEARVLLIEKWDWPIIAFVVWMLLSVVVNVASLDGKVASHTMSYIAVLSLYYIAFRSLISKSKVDFDTIMRWVTVSVLFASVFGVFEFLGKNILGYNIDNLVPRYEQEHEYNPLYFGFVRARSFMSESGNFALFLEVFSPVIVYYWWSKQKTIIALVILTIVIGALCTTMSAAAMASLMTGLTVGISLYFFKNIFVGTWRAEFIFSMFRIAVLFALLVVIVFLVDGVGYIVPLFEKIGLVGGASVEDRLYRWEMALIAISINPVFGVAPGGFLVSNIVGQGVVSWWLQVFLEGGIPAGLFLFLFFVLNLRMVLGITSNIKYAYIVSLVSAIIHYAVISDYWFPWLWVLIVMIQFTYKKSYSGKSDFQVCSISSDQKNKCKEGSW